MYSVVLMVAATTGGDMASFGNKGGCSGCDGSVASCHGGGFLGLKDKMGCNGGGFLGHKDKSGCHGSCHGTPTSCSGCSGTVIVHSAPAPASCHGCSGSCHGSCHGGGFLGLRDGGGLFKKKGGCNGCSGCHGW